MPTPTAYDMTRLITRLLNVTPNGIDRVDYAFAEHFLSPADAERFGLMMSFQGPRLFPLEASRAAIKGIATHWGEDRTPEADPVYLRLVAQLTGRAPAALKAVPRIAQGRSGQWAGLLRWLARYGAPIGRSPRRDLPKGARYVNVSQYPLWIAAYFEWLENRRDVKAMFFIHDLLPIEMPEYFRAAEYERHRQRLANLARFGAAALVNTEAVKAALADYLRQLGRSDLPIFVAPLPCAATFAGPKSVDPALRAKPYFVMCGTIEPRKNHLMLLHVWRELVKRDGPGAPKLVLVGERGWKYGPVVDLLERSPSLRDHVIEVRGLTTPALKKLLDNACALLMPSFAEGYGLPVREALAAATPVIASDIPAFGTIADDRLQLLSPINGEIWLETIRAYAENSAPSSIGSAAAAKSAETWATYFEKIDAFVSEI